MGVFDDKKFEQLNWMTQITETIESELNGLLARLPDRLDLTVDNLTSFMDVHYGLRLSVDRVVRKLLRDYQLEDSNFKSVTYDEETKLASCFKFEVEPGTKVDFESNRLIGSITMVKVVSTFEDDVLQKDMGKDGMAELNRISWDPKGISRINDIMELLGGSCLERLRDRSINRKMSAITNRLREILEKNEWRIRDTELANKIGRWIAAYIENGNLPAYSNFCKLKVMTHNNMPIYSIDEEQW